MTSLQRNCEDGFIPLILPQLFTYKTIFTNARRLPANREVGFGIETYQLAE